VSQHVHDPQCEKLLGNLSDYIDGELQAELCSLIERHLQQCDNCRIVVNTLRKTVELYRQTSQPGELPGSVRERLFLKLELEEYLQKGEN
jgi:predicted anti-sigma-YlaC factor YlaD